MASIFGVKRVYITYKDSGHSSKRTQSFLRKIKHRMLYRTTAVYCKDHMEYVMNKVSGENANFIALEVHRSA